MKLTSAVVFLGFICCVTSGSGSSYLSTYYSSGGAPYTLNSYGPYGGYYYSAASPVVASPVASLTAAPVASFAAPAPVARVASIQAVSPAVAPVSVVSPAVAPMQAVAPALSYSNYITTGSKPVDVVYGYTSGYANPLAGYGIVGYPGYPFYKK